MKHKIILELTKLFYLQRKALTAGKKNSSTRISALIEKKAKQLKKTLKTESIRKEKEKASTNSVSQEDVITMQLEWEKTKAFMQEVKQVCNGFYLEEQNEYSSSGEKKFSKRSTTKIATA